MDRYRCLEAFVAVAESQSFASAARRLSVSRSSVSERIAQLEALTGTALFSRTTRSVVPTNQGTALYNAYAPVLTEMRRLENFGGTDEISGRLRVGCVVDIGLHEGSRAVAALAARHPNLACELILGDGPTNPLGAGFDMTLHYRRVRASSLVQVEIKRIRCGLFASPSYVREAETLAEPSGLSDMMCFGYSYQGAVEDWNVSDWSFRRRQADGGFEDATVRVSLLGRVNSSTALRTLLEEGRGVGVLPLVRARQSVADGRLVRLLPDWQPPALLLLATMPKGMAASPRVRAFLTALETVFADT